jgi:3',5'-cyclic AMP phosphodiesterase CpdA
MAVVYSLVFEKKGREAAMVKRSSIPQTFKTYIMTSKIVLVVVLLSQLLLSCKKQFREDAVATLSEETRTMRSNDNRHLKIAIVSDIHYMHPSLLVNHGESGAAFQNYLDEDPKLIQYSDPIWREVMQELKAENPDILLVPGDITKDGEKVGHEAMAGFLNQLRSNGMKVYVIPGNHDINNAKAKRYDGNNDYPVTMTSKEEFASIYSNFGYNDAIAKDPNSLSYVVQPQRDLRIIGIDACKYEEYGPSGDVPAGRIKPATLSWILAQLADAKAKNITIFAMMHHNLIEHYTNQSELDPGYVIDDWKNVTNTLMDAGLKIIFTGHYHANDISSYRNKDKVLYDIETGSLVTAPIPYRIITMKDNKLEISTHTVQNISAALPANVSFPAYTNLFLSQHLDGYFNYYIANNLYAPSFAEVAAPLFRNGIMAHFAGDEKMPPDQRKKIDALAAMPPLVTNPQGASPQQLAGIINILWTDIGEKDNKTTVDY